MYSDIIPQKYGKLITVPTQSICMDGRKIPSGVDLGRFVQLGVYNWVNGAPYDKTIFTYNPFHQHPVRKRSIVDIVDQSRTRFQPKHHRGINYYLHRTFDEQEQYDDPLHCTESGIIVIERDIQEGVVFYQYNDPELEDDQVSVIEATQESFMELLSKIRKHELFIGTLQQKGIS